MRELSRPFFDNFAEFLLYEVAVAATLGRITTFFWIEYLLRDIDANIET
jgi:hypothetical protein